MQENTKKPQGLFVLAKSALNDNLSELLWSAECEHPTSIECVATSNEGEYRIDIAMDLKSVVKTDPSTVVHLKARTKDGLEYFETDFRVSFGFNVSTSPRILVLKKQTDEYLGMVIVRKTDYLNDEIREVEKQLELQSGESYGNRTPIFAKVSRMKNGSFLVKFRLVAADVPCLDDFEKCRLVLDLEKPEFNIPVLFQ